MPISDYNPVFDEPTPPRAAAADGEPAAAEKLAEPPSPAPETARPARPARARTVAEAPAELDKEALGDWRWRLSATAGKAVKAQQRADEAARAWERVVAEARHAGVPERLLMAAALEADMDLPAAE